MHLTRRNLFAALGATAMARLLAPGAAHAATPVDRSFLFVHFEGAWDITMSLDPRDPAVFTDARKDETRIELGWSRLQGPFGEALISSADGKMQFGPAIGRLHTQAKNMCLVRGMSMDTLTHPVGTRYFLTGKQPAGLNARGSSLGSELADLTLANGGALPEPVPHLVVDTEAYYVGNQARSRPFRAGTQNVYQLVFAFQRGIGDGVPDLLLDKMNNAVGGANVSSAYRTTVRDCDPTGLAALGAHRAYRLQQQGVNDMIARNLGVHFNLGNLADPAMAALNARYGSAALGSAGSAGAIALQALKHGVSRYVTVRLQKDLDTHTGTWAAEQPRLQKEGFDVLTTLLEDLETTPDARRGGTLLDHTTVVVFSEFSRTPYLNPAGGRDHSLTNACMLFGAGVKKNTVVGASSDVGMEPQTIDPVTGLVATGPSAVVIRPEHVLASVMESAGYSADVLRVGGLPCLKG